MNTEAFIQLALEEDIGMGDHTTLSCIPKDAIGDAQLVIKADGIIAGLELAEQIFRQVEPEINFEKNISDGDSITRGMVAFHIRGKVHTLLTCERLVLNCMQRMSGIATLTRSYVEAVKPHGTKILDTRKTTPLLRNFEKQAVKLGGGYNHRMGLYDMILIKDNHVDFAGGIEIAIQWAKDYLAHNNLNIPIEVETRNIKEIDEVIQSGGVDRVMFDNFSPELMRKAVEMVDGRMQTEASGGITLNNVASYAATGVDCISVGALTHSAVSLDLSLKATKG